LFVVTTSVVTALLGGCQVTPSAIARPLVRKQALDSRITRVMSYAITREQRLKSLLQTWTPSPHAQFHPP
jgi:hypothetical protein